jgi:hypothetical protein
VAEQPDLRVAKLGITDNGDRVRRLASAGWTLIAKTAFATARQALEAEKRVLRHLRTDLDLPRVEALRGSLGGGYTETVSTDHMPAETLASLVDRAARDSGTEPQEQTEQPAPEASGGRPRTT